MISLAAKVGVSLFFAIPLAIIARNTKPSFEVIVNKNSPQITSEIYPKGTVGMNIKLTPNTTQPEANTTRLRNVNTLNTSK